MLKALVEETTEEETTEEEVEERRKSEEKDLLEHKNKTTNTSAKESCERKENKRTYRV